MEMKVDADQILMSDVLRGQVPELDEATHALVEKEQSKYVTLIAERTVASKTDAMVGILRGVLLGQTIEIEFRCDLSEALTVIKSDQVTFNRFELHHGEDTVIPIAGPFDVKARRVDEISATDQMCTLGLHLERQAK